MINVGRMKDTENRVFEMIKRLHSIPKNMIQPLEKHAEMVEVCEIFQMDSKGQKLLPIMILVEMFDRLVSREHNTKEDVRDIAKEHVIMEMGWSDTRVPVIFMEPMPERRGEVITNPGDKDDEVDRSCVEVHGNEGWLAKY